MAKRSFAPSLPVVTALAALGQLAVSVLLVGGEGGHRWMFPDTVLTPAPYAFSIWGVIFLGSLAYGAYQLSRRSPNPALLRNTRPPMAAAFVLCAVWLGVAESGLLTLTVPVHLGLLVAVALGFSEVVRRRQRAGLTPAEVAFVSWPLGLYAGWVTLAFAANLASVLAAWLPVPAMRALAPALLAGTGFVGAAAVDASDKHPTYTLALVWGLVAVARGNLDRGCPGGAALAAGLLVLVVVRFLRGRG